MDVQFFPQEPKHKYSSGLSAQPLGCQGQSPNDLGLAIRACLRQPRPTQTSRESCPGATEPQTWGGTGGGAEV